MQALHLRYFIKNSLINNNSDIPFDPLGKIVVWAAALLLFQQLSNLNKFIQLIQPYRSYLDCVIALLISSFKHFCSRQSLPILI